MLSCNYPNWRSSKHLARREQSQSGLDELRKSGSAFEKHAIYSTIGMTINTYLN